MILGIDEVGRGPWAGPIVVGAVVLDEPIEGLNDSKRLSKKKRELLDVTIRQTAKGYGLGWVHADELDDIGMAAAMRLATRRAVEAVSVPYHEIIIDGTVNFLEGTTKGRFVTVMPKADGLIPSVSAASIIAKVARDRFMETQDSVYDGYQFGKHAGYGTAAHRAAIEQHGVTPLHRRSFAPLKSYEIGQPTTKSIGDAAEDVVATYLEGRGYTLLERQWRQRYCEVDIIAEKDGRLVIVEVKHRNSSQQGSGIDAVTARKLGKLRLAAHAYASRTQRLEQPIALVVVATTGNPPTVVDLVEVE